MECGVFLFIGLIILIIAALNDHSKRQAKESLIDSNMTEIGILKRHIAEIEKNFKTQVEKLERKIRSLEKLLTDSGEIPLPVLESPPMPEGKRHPLKEIKIDKPKVIRFAPLEGENTVDVKPEPMAKREKIDDQTAFSTAKTEPSHSLRADVISPAARQKQTPQPVHLSEKDDDDLVVTSAYVKTNRSDKQKEWDDLIRERREKERGELASLVPPGEIGASEQLSDRTEKSESLKCEEEHDETFIRETDACIKESPETINHKIQTVSASVPVSTTTSPQYSEKASHLEMELAGKWISVAGIILIMAGMIFFLRQAMQATKMGIIPQGLPQVLFGGLLGITLTVLGRYFHKKDMQALGQSLMAGGFCVMFFAAGAAHFYFHLINPLVLGILFFFIIAASGLSMLKLNSKIIAAVVLIIAFSTPFLMMFQLRNLTLLYVYLLAINLGVVLVAYYKKWDQYIMAAFLMTYLHYFWNIRFIQGNTGTTLTFLSLFYMIFLLSNNLYHFKQKVSGGYNLFITYFNPLLYGCISYYILMKSPNWQALSTYISLALIHLYIAGKARSLEEHDPSFEAMTRTNLVLGLMFLTTSISFITFFTDTDRYFSLVTGLWWVEAFVLMMISLKIGFCDRIIRRFSYLTIGIIWAQLISVISWMPQLTSWQIAHKFSIYFVSMLLFYAFFRLMYRNKHEMDSEDNFMMAATLLSCFGIVVYLTYSFYNIYAMMLLLSVVACLVLYSSVKFHDRLRNFNTVSYFMMGGISIVMFSLSVWNQHFIPNFFRSTDMERTVLLTLTASVYVLFFLILFKFRKELDDVLHPVMMELTVIMPLIIAFRVGLNHLGSAWQIPLLASFLASIPVVLSFRFEERMKNLRSFANLIFLAIPIFFAGLEIYTVNEKMVSAFFNMSFPWKAVIYILVSLVYAGYFRFLRQHYDRLNESDKSMVGICIIAIFAMIMTLVWTKFTIFGLMLIAAFLTNVMLYLTFKFPDELRQIRKLPYFLMGFITFLIFIAPFKTLDLPFLNSRFIPVLGIAFMFFNAWYLVRKNEDRLIDIHTWYHPYIWSIIALVLMKGTVMESYGMASTFLWCLTGLGILYLSLFKIKDQKLETVAFMILSFALVKSLVYDSSAISLADEALTKFPTKGGDSGAAFISSAYTFYQSSAMVIDIILLLIISGIYYIASHLKADDPKMRDIYQAFSLIVLSFQFSSILFRVYGVLDEFQVMLTVFWGAISLISIVIGLTINRKIFRLFGLVLLLASTAKIVLVDIWVLKFFFMAFPLLVMGGILIATSFLYQKHRDELMEKPELKAEVIAIQES